MGLELNVHRLGHGPDGDGRDHNLAVHHQDVTSLSPGVPAIMVNVHPQLVVAGQTAHLELDLGSVTVHPMPEARAQFAMHLVQATTNLTRQLRVEQG